ncbi:MAG: hypothetical protein M0020_01640 [Actinomycetota bacterium]|jgi:hypothetical protein|nr:hypothetical protein [Actinomycetota bacterium]
MSPYPHLSDSLPQLATPDEVAPLLSMTALGVVRQCRAGKLPGIKVAGRWLVHVGRLAALLDAEPGAAGPRPRGATPG